MRRERSEQLHKLGWNRQSGRARPFGRGGVRVPRQTGPANEREGEGSGQTATARVKGSRRKIQGMDEIPPFNTAEVLRNLMVTLSWMGLADISPQVQVQLGRAINLQKATATNGSTTPGRSNMRPLAQPRRGRGRPVATEDTLAVHTYRL